MFDKAGPCGFIEHLCGCNKSNAIMFVLKIPALGQAEER